MREPFYCLFLDLIVEQSESSDNFIEGRFFRELHPFVAERTFAESEDYPGGFPLQLKPLFQALEMEDVPALASNAGRLAEKFHVA